jgi:hypothetical protein
MLIQQHFFKHEATRSDCSGELTLTLMCSADREGCYQETYAPEANRQPGRAQIDMQSGVRGTCRTQEGEKGDGGRSVEKERR